MSYAMRIQGWILERPAPFLCLRDMTFLFRADAMFLARRRLTLTYIWLEPVWRTALVRARQRLPTMVSRSPVQCRSDTVRHGA